nr:MarR family transcriptional regulator [Maliibacterium massiliense]
MEILNKWIATAARYNQIYFSKCFEHLGLTGGQYLFIINICLDRGITQDQLADKLAMNKSTIARVVAQLEEGGFLLRRSNENDKRVYNLYPTEKATAMLPQIVDIIQQWNDCLTEDFTQEERDIFEVLMIKLTRNAIAHARLLEGS